MMQVNDASTRIFPADARGQDSHVASENDVVDVIVIEDLDHSTEVWISFVITDHFPVAGELFGETAAMGPIAHHHGSVGMNLTIANSA